MVKKRKSKNILNKDSGKQLTTSLIISIVIGLIVGTFLLIVLDDLLYFAISPLITLCIGFAVGSFLEKKGIIKHKELLHKGTNKR